MDTLGKPRKIARPAAKPTDPAGSGATGAPQIRRPRPRPTPPAESKPREKSLEGLGQLLKTKREINGLTRKDVVVKIKIPLDQLESIEDGRLSSLPPVFAKGFLRAYANELGLDAEAILEDYRQMTGGFKNEPASRGPLAQRYVETSVKSGRLRPRSRGLIVVGVLLVAALALTLWLWPGLRHSLGSALPILGNIPGFSVADEEISPGNPPADGPGTSGTSSIADSGQNFVEDPIDPSLEPVNTVRGSISLPPPSGGPAASAARGGTLTLASSEDKVWVQVTVDDNPTEYLLMRPGQRVTWEAKRSVTVVTGRASALNATWDGQNLGALGTSANPTVEVTFPKS